MGLFSRKDPAHEARKYLNQMPGISHQTYDPYIQQGQQASGIYGQQTGQMAQDPAAFYDQLMARYQPSKQYDMQNQAQQHAATNASTAGGMRGTQQDVSNAAQISDRLMGEDMQRWYGNISGLQTQGLQGQQNIADRGFTASQGLGGDLNNMYGMQGGMAAQGAAQHNQGRMDLLKGLFGAGAFAAGLPTQGGGSFGGDMMSNWMK